MISVSFCHNVKSLEVVGETLALQFFVDIFFFILKKDEIAINEATVSLDNVVGKVLHHAWNTGVDIIIEIVGKIASLGEDNVGSSKKIYWDHCNGSRFWRHQ